MTFWGVLEMRLKLPRFGNSTPTVKAYGLGKVVYKVCVNEEFLFDLSLKKFLYIIFTLLSSLLN